jgi:hypothetical protein
MLATEGAMWATLQDQSFLLGAVLVTLVHATKFGELNLGNPVTGRYLALLPGAKVRDFVGPYAYHVALLAFLGVSLTAYYLACQLSPDILQGAAKLLGYVDADKTIQGVPYPLYVAALFIGLTQPIVPVFSRFGEAQRDFFHDQIEVPRRLIDLAERLASAVEARAAADKRLLAREVRNLVSGNVFSTVQTYGDLAFYKLQLERLDLGDPGALDNAIKESSATGAHRANYLLHAGRGDAAVRDESSGQGRRCHWSSLFKASLQQLRILCHRPRGERYAVFHLHLDDRTRFRPACRTSCAPVREVPRSEPLAQQSRQCWQRALDDRASYLCLPDSGR